MSPIPVPKNEEDIGNCVRFLRREGKPPKQCVAICLDLARKHASEKKAKEK